MTKPRTVNDMVRHPTPRSAPSFALVLFGLLLAAPVAAQGLRLEVFNVRRQPSGVIWGADGWVAYCVEESDKSLNGDQDTDDAVLHVTDTRTLQTFNTGIALDAALADEEEDDWPVAIGGNLMAVQASETDNGEHDLNGDGTDDHDVLQLYDLTTKKSTNLGLVGRMPTFVGKTLYFVQTERPARRDLNADGDQLDGVLCSMDTSTRQITSMGMEAHAGYEAVEGFVVAWTSEQAQGGKDLNGDRDLADVVAQLHRKSDGKWENLGLECAFGTALTPVLCAVGVEESQQGNKDLNGDSDTADTVCLVVNLETGAVINTGQDCSGELLADAGVVAMLTGETDQGKRDLNGDRDSDDEVAQVFLLSTGKTTNMGRDGSGGLWVARGKVGFIVSEEDNGGKDANGDKDAQDYVVMVYDPATNQVRNTQIAADGDLYGGGQYLAWTCLEEDQYNRDQNRDGDTDDSIVYVMDVTTLAVSGTQYAASDSICVSGTAFAFATPEEDQGARDLDGNGSNEDEVLHIARVRR